MTSATVYDALRTTTRPARRPGRKGARLRRALGR